MLFVYSLINFKMSDFRSLKWFWWYFDLTVCRVWWRSEEKTGW